MELFKITMNYNYSNDCSSFHQFYSDLKILQTCPLFKKGYRIEQNFGGENFGEFGKTIVICQYFTQPNSRFTIVTNGSYCKFANAFLAKTLKQSICQSFASPTFCAVWYIVPGKNFKAILYVSGRCD